MKTINGIYLNLKESEYKLNYNGLIYYFSSELYMNKFKNNVKQFIVEETAKLKTKYKINEKETELTEEVLLANQILMK